MEHEEAYCARYQQLTGARAEPFLDDGNCTDIEALVAALEKLTEVMTLKYSVVAKLQNISLK